MDYLSVGAYESDDGTIAHQALLGAGTCIAEGLNLTQVKAGDCEFICLPLRIENGDGSPVRALLRMV
jgi:arylformamidase